MSGRLVVINDESLNFYILQPKGIAGGRGRGAAINNWLSLFPVRK